MNRRRALCGLLGLTGTLVLSDLVVAGPEKFNIYKFLEQSVEYIKHKINTNNLTDIEISFAVMHSVHTCLDNNKDIEKNVDNIVMGAIGLCEESIGFKRGGTYKYDPFRHRIRTNDGLIKRGMDRWNEYRKKLGQKVFTRVELYED